MGELLCHLSDYKLSKESVHGVIWIVALLVNTSTYLKASSKYQHYSSLLRVASQCLHYKVLLTLTQDFHFILMCSHWSYHQYTHGEPHTNTDFYISHCCYLFNLHSHEHRVLKQNIFIYSPHWHHIKHVNSNLFLNTLWPKIIS